MRVARSGSLSKRMPGTNLLSFSFLIASHKFQIACLFFVWSDGEVGGSESGMRNEIRGKWSETE